MMQPNLISANVAEYMQPTKGTIMTDANEQENQKTTLKITTKVSGQNTFYKRALDAASVAFLAYWPYFAIWSHHNPHLEHPMQFQLVLLIADVAPTVFAIFWLLYRYLDALRKRFPFIDVFMNNGWYHAIFFMCLAATVILAKTLWR